VNGINFDLIYGLPHQTVASCVETVLRCIELKPDRFSVFGYAHVPGFKPHQQRIRGIDLPNGEERYRQFEATAALLADAGYIRIGLDHFCLPENAMSLAQSNGTLRRNFQGYTTDAANVLLGFGASAIGRLQQGYVQNEVGMRAYAKALASGVLATIKGRALTDEDRMRGEIIERIMCDFGADVGEICQRYGRSPNGILQGSSQLGELVAAGVALISGTKLRVPEDASLLCATLRRYSTNIWTYRAARTAERSRCRVPECGGISQADPLFREALWARYFTAAPRPRTPSELRYSDRRLRSKSSPHNTA